MKTTVWFRESPAGRWLLALGAVVAASATNPVVAYAARPATGREVKQMLRNTRKKTGRCRFLVMRVTTSEERGWYAAADFRCGRSSLKLLLEKQEEGFAFGKGWMQEYEWEEVCDLAPYLRGSFYFGGRRYSLGDSCTSTQQVTPPSTPAEEAGRRFERECQERGGQLEEEQGQYDGHRPTFDGEVCSVA